MSSGVSCAEDLLWLQGRLRPLNHRARQMQPYSRRGGVGMFSNISQKSSSNKRMSRSSGTSCVDEHLQMQGRLRPLNHRGRQKRSYSRGGDVCIIGNLCKKSSSNSRSSRSSRAGLTRVVIVVVVVVVVVIEVVAAAAAVVVVVVVVVVDR